MALHNYVFNVQIYREKPKTNIKTTTVERNKQSQKTTKTHNKRNLKTNPNPSVKRVTAGRRRSQCLQARMR